VENWNAFILIQQGQNPAATKLDYLELRHNQHWLANYIHESLKLREVGLYVYPCFQEYNTKLTPVMLTEQTQ
jgi:hypothetical protein